MKKILTILIMSAICSTANAARIITPIRPITPAQTYQNGYSAGYHAGKNNAYDHVAKTVFVVSAVVVAGIIVYELGKESRWGINQDGNITYRF